MKRILLLCFIVQSLLLSNVFTNGKAEDASKSYIKSYREYKLFMIRATIDTHNYRITQLINDFVDNTPYLKKLKNRTHTPEASNIALNRVTKAIHNPKAHPSDYNFILELTDKI